jgi:hypothetical protein
MKSIQKKDGVFIPESIRREAIKAKEFLSQHPAIGNAREYKLGSETLSWNSVESCKRGYGILDPVTIIFTEKNYKKYKKDFDARYSSERLLKDPEYCYLLKSYKEGFGEPWKFHHVIYSWDTPFYVYTGPVDRETNDWLNYKNWQAYCYKNGQAPTLEECYIQAANQVKKDLGNFNIFESFLTKEEKANHKTERMYNHRPTKSLEGKEDGSVLLEENAKHLKVHDGMINRRWLKWFISKNDFPFGKDIIKLSKIQPPTK